jgi:hypothetical protein
MWMSTFRIQEFKPGRVLDGHVHDVLGFPEPVWPYSSHPKAKDRLRDWLKSKDVEVYLPGQGRASDDCVILVRGLRESFEAVSENHALCLAVLMTKYLLEHGRKIPVKGRW